VVLSPTPVGERVKHFVGTSTQCGHRFGLCHNTSQTALRTFVLRIECICNIRWDGGWVTKNEGESSFEQRLHVELKPAGSSPDSARCSLVLWESSQTTHVRLNSVKLVKCFQMGSDPFNRLLFVASILSNGTPLVDFTSTSAVPLSICVSFRYKTRLSCRARYSPIPVVSK
jgi:hypothetical protein